MKLCLVLLSAIVLPGCSWFRNHPEALTAAELASETAPMVCATMPKKRDREDCLRALELVQGALALAESRLAAGSADSGGVPAVPSAEPAPVEPAPAELAPAPSSVP